MLALYVCSLTANIVVGVIIRAAVGVSVIAATRNKLIRLIVMWSIGSPYRLSVLGYLVSY